MIENGMLVIVGPDGKPIQMNIRELTYETLNKIKGLAPAMIELASTKVGNNWNSMFHQTEDCLLTLRSHGCRTGLDDVVKVLIEDIMPLFQRLHDWYVGYFTSDSYDYTIPNGERKQIKALVQRYQLGMNDVLLNHMVGMGVNTLTNTVTSMGAVYRRLADLLKHSDKPCNCEECQKEHRDPEEFRDSCVHASHSSWHDLATGVTKMLTDGVPLELTQRAIREHGVFQRLVDEGLNPEDAINKALTQIRDTKKKKTKVDVNQKLPDLPDLDKLFDIK